MGTITGQSTKTIDCECLCKQHKPALKKLLSGVFSGQNIENKRCKYVQHPQEGDPVEQMVLKIASNHPAKLACIACIRTYLFLLKDPRGEGISESYLSSSYRNCCLSMNKR